MTTINPASYSHQPTYPLFGTSTTAANPSVTDVATALFRMTTPLGGDGNPLTSRDRWQMCIYAVINKRPWFPGESTDSSDPERYLLQSRLMSLFGLNCFL
ncbi:hypothetical protein B9Z55_009857 [Caenorhabditis nigoni]|uniref:Uncharacterized protein n=1 Tax=Caenorhabditis nigoni TaxID=1611254 RepID=A0A2G5UTT0_9PELO|nr:hypothetical protein B9Z55_009857 [Caenorhabditis nigoni]